MADDNQSNHSGAGQAPIVLNQPLTGLPTGDLKKTFTSAGTANDALSFTNLDLSGGRAQVSTTPTSTNANTKK